MAVSLNVKRQLVQGMRGEIARAGDLYERMVTNGMTRNAGGDPVGLLQVDRRDAAQFIFFEVAAKFESFLVDAFEIEVRVRLDIQPQRAEYVMGTIDRGLQGVMGWAVPETVRNRARNLHGVNGFFARINTVLGNANYERLAQAHRVRNRIAHASGRAVTDYRNILANLGVPAGSRKGMSPGRLLAEYPLAAGIDDRWFHRFLAAYERCIGGFNRSVRV